MPPLPRPEAWAAGSKSAAGKELGIRSLQGGVLPAS